MDHVAVLLQLVAKTLFLAMPFGVSWLAFRRLALSESINAWRYAACGLFAGFTALGLTPWAIGVADVSWVFFLLAALCPPVWVLVVLICNYGRSDYYYVNEDEDEKRVIAFKPFRSKQNPPPLVLEDPHWPDAPRPIFRHSRPPEVANVNTSASSDAHTQVVGNTVAAALPAVAKPERRTLLGIAKEMRGRPETPRKREPLLLPAPENLDDLKNLPFLKPGAS